eukprot:TRINITY_DN3474_c0_g1_i11.p1 TRINITY_DN3474_c0_g1~~TRINITY_DN3474_c0_g1_i11.p1  ORF type:complete len:426 (+),score=86.81 TRINITY_DN3474_c0_g1_i11:198-1475(+)
MVVLAASNLLTAIKYAVWPDATMTGSDVVSGACPPFLGEASYYRLTCSIVWINFVWNLMFAPALLMDASLHKLSWESTSRRLMVKVFGDLPWSRYQMLSSDWTEIELLAAGAQGEIHVGVLRRPPSDPDASLDCAVKRPHVDGEGALEEVLQEARVLMHLHAKLAPGDHEHIVGLVGFCCSLPDVALLIQLCDTDLCRHLAQLRQKKPPSMGDPLPPSPGQQLPRRLVWAMQAAKGIRALHSASVAHLDIKSDNVLIADDVAKIGDFGHAVLHEGVGSEGRLSANSGTLAFMAPEVFVETGKGELCECGEILCKFDPFLADAFSFGFLLYECVTFEREPRGRGEAVDWQPPSLDKGEMAELGGGCVPGELEDLVSRCFSTEPCARPTFDQIVTELELVLAGMSKADPGGESVRAGSTTFEVVAGI